MKQERLVVRKRLQKYVNQWNNSTIIIFCVIIITTKSSPQENIREEMNLIQDLQGLQRCISTYPSPIPRVLSETKLMNQ